MIRRSLLLILSLAFCLGGLACGILSPEPSFAATHPQELSAGRPVCSGCHDGKDALKGAMKPYASFDHTDAFVKDHRFQANRDPGVCGSCHSQSFCADCHGGKTPMAPSVKLGNRPDRATPHRGNYLNLHRMDGKMDPTACYKCHGRANNDKCTACHK